MKALIVAGALWFALLWVAQPAEAAELQTPSMEFEWEFEAGAFTGGGGPLLMGLLLDLGELNASLDGLMDLKGTFTVGERTLLWASGGFGFGGPRLRLGGFGAGGEWSFPTRTEGAIDQVRLSIGLGGMLAEQLLIEGRAGGLILGILVGGGGWALELIETTSGSFSDIVKDPPRFVDLERGFWFALPYLAFEAKLLDFIGLRASAGYGLTISLSDWELPGGQPVPGGPLGSVLFPYLQLMLVFGG